MVKARARELNNLAILNIDGTDNAEKMTTNPAISKPDIALQQVDLQ